VLLDDELRRQLLRAFTEDDRLHVEELARLFRMVQVRCLSCVRVQSVCATNYCTRHVGCGRIVHGPCNMRPMSSCCTAIVSGSLCAPCCKKRAYPRLARAGWLLLGGKPAECVGLSACLPA
jgi:hypothetical protein